MAIVAAGAVTPIGLDLDAFWAGLLAGADGLSVSERFPTDDLKMRRGGEIKKLPAVAQAMRSRAGPVDIQNGGVDRMSEMSSMLSIAPCHTGLLAQRAE